MRDAVVFMAGPGDTGISGGDVHALRLVDRWRERGADVALITPARIAHVHTVEQRGRAVTALTTPLDGSLDSIARYSVAVVWRTLAALRLAPRARVAVAASHFVHDVIPAWWVGRRHGARVAVYAYHLVGQSGRTRSVRSTVSILGERLSLAFLRRSADIVFVDNQETAAALRAAGFTADQVRHTQNAYDPLEELEQPEPADPPQLLFVGRLVAVKGIDVALDVAAELQRSAVDARVVVLGDGPLREQIAARVAAQGLANVELRGFVPEAEKWAALREAALFLFPSREEGWGIAVGEALLAGVPALVFDLPAYTHFGELPERVALGDDAAFRERAVALTIDDETRAALRARVAAGRDALPRWAGVLDAELHVLEAA